MEVEEVEELKRTLSVLRQSMSEAGLLGQPMLKTMLAAVESAAEDLIGLYGKTAVKLSQKTIDPVTWLIKDDGWDHMMF